MSNLPSGNSFLSSRADLVKVGEPKLHVAWVMLTDLGGPDRVHPLTATHTRLDKRLRAGVNRFCPAIEQVRPGLRLALDHLLQLHLIGQIGLGCISRELPEIIERFRPSLRLASQSVEDLAML